jgi:hypothetical protein
LHTFRIGLPLDQSSKSLPIIEIATQRFPSANRNINREQNKQNTKPGGLEENLEPIIFDGLNSTDDRNKRQTKQKSDGQTNGCKKPIEHKNTSRKLPRILALLLKIDKEGWVTLFLAVDKV